MLPKEKKCDKLIIIMGVNAMNVYDFDNTLYDGESTLDFYFYCCRRHPALYRFMFVVLINLVKYKLCLISEEKLMQLCNSYVKSFLEGCPDIVSLSEGFWKVYGKKLRRFYKDVHKDDDVIISASFGFLLRLILPELGVKNLVCSEIDLDTKEVISLCFRKNKKTLFKELYPNSEICDFYTDSYNDLPLMECAKGNVYLVKGEKITLINIEKQVF